MSGKIKKIKIFFEKGKPGEIVAQAEAVADCGLQGDRFAKGGQKQLTIIDTACDDWVNSPENDGLCFKRFKANITVENLDLSTLKTGDKLACGGAVFEISAAAKECFGECDRVQAKMDCMLRCHAKYLTVLKSGTIKENDEIVLK